MLILNPTQMDSAKAAILKQVFLMTVHVLYIVKISIIA